MHFTSGYRYRPPPVLDQPQSVSQVQFDKHMKALCKSYNEKADNDNQSLVVCVNLVEQIGRESILAEAFLEVRYFKFSAVERVLAH